MERITVDDIQKGDVVRMAGKIRAVVEEVDRQDVKLRKAKRTPSDYWNVKDERDQWTEEDEWYGWDERDIKDILLESAEILCFNKEALNVNWIEFYRESEFHPQFHRKRECIFSGEDFIGKFLDI